MEREHFRNLRLGQLPQLRAYAVPKRFPLPLAIALGLAIGFILGKVLP